MVNFFYLIVGIGVLTVGGDILVRGSLSIARHLGISPLLSGLIIVGFGTSMPELIVSVNAALSNQPDIAIGNVVGSNISNILLILGLCALITPLTVKPSVLRRDALLVVIASGLFIILASGNTLGRIDAAGFFLVLVAYLAGAIWSERTKNGSTGELYKAEAAEVSVLPKSSLWAYLASIVGLLLLIGGSQILLKGAVGVAKNMGVSEAVIGLTLVAVGTSIPELTISLIATFRRHADVAVGNILGSNIFNLLGILSISAFIQPLTIHPRIREFDQWVMFGSSLVLLLFLLTGLRLNRWEGGALFVGYCVYVGLSFSLVGH